MKYYIMYYLYHTLLLYRRGKVCKYVRLRILALRKEYANQLVNYSNASAIRTNAMRYLPNYFNKQQLEKIFFCFPDPQ